MINLDYILQACTVFCDGYGKAGTSEKITPPKIKKKTEKFRGGGMIGERMIGMGYDAFEFEFSLNSVDPQVIKLAGVKSGNTVPLTIRGYLIGDQSATHTAVFTCSGEIIEEDFGAWEAGKKANLKVKCALIALKLTIDDAEIYDIDIANGIDSWGGTDAGAAMLQALGY